MSNFSPKIGWRAKNRSSRLRAVKFSKLQVAHWNVPVGHFMTRGSVVCHSCYTVYRNWLTTKKWPIKLSTRWCLLFSHSGWNISRPISYWTTVDLQKHRTASMRVTQPKLLKISEYWVTQIDWSQPLHKPYLALSNITKQGKLGNDIKICRDTPKFWITNQNAFWCPQPPTGVSILENMRNQWVPHDLAKVA